MPYTGPDDEKLPENVKKLDKGKRAQWVEVWNSAHKKCMADGGDTKTCEMSAFKQANGVAAKSDKANAVTEFWENIKRLVDKIVGDDDLERAAYPWDKCIADQTKKYGSKKKAEEVCGAIKAKYGKRDDSADIFLPDDFDLAKALAEIERELGIEPERAIAYLPTQTRSFTITRDAQGVPRWLMIAASAVVNKVGAIDSTTLFDNFIRHAAETSEYPVLDFFHEGARVRFGVADWLKRDGALYLASGGFDDTDLARAAIAGLEAQADYWGASIAYRVTQEPLMLISEGQIPVYTDGVNNFISIVPKRLAANLFTATLVAEEVNRMNKAAYEELVKLVGEERAKQFESQVDDANRTITETGMVTRAEDAPVVQPTPEVPPAPPVETRQEPPPSIAPDELAALKAQLTELAAKVTALEQQQTAERTAKETEQKRATDALADLTSRLAGVEASKERWDSWLNDAPEHIKVEADKIYRARNQEPAPMTMAQLAEQNVSKLNHAPHGTRQH